MSGLNSQAEQYAKEATNLNAFNNLNLIGVKEQIAELLGMIGRVEGIFSTYSKHDISHIDAMLAMLDWLIPPSTRQVLTPTDWLLIVLSLYLHDLGMFVPSAEYDSRHDNPAFQKFLDILDKDPGAKDYLARAKSMKEDEQERFFYQEFIRSHHASRIREWVNGRLSRSWPPAVQLIAKEIGNILQDLPTRFREHLALVCESHHRDDLNKLDVYPLYQMYGASQVESANVQYAALILRTADLIHVTKDRTPSRMYRLINFSDLKSIDEWDKQKDTFSVHMKTRTFDPSDTDSHVIIVNADFTEERPFFALTEYLAWADSQIKQTKRWADKSQNLADGEHYFYPWRGIQGNILVEGNSPRQMRFELDRGRLLDLLVGHTIYNDPTVALRELLQNSIDAVRFQYYQEKQQARTGDPEPEMGSIIVKWNPTTRELIVQDNGTGMDLDIIQSHLLKVGSSFYDSPQFEADNANFSPISRFGIGILTCFMISDNIEIITFRGNEGRRIKLTSVHAEYLLKDLQSGDPLLEGLEPHGTRVRLILRPTVDIIKQSIDGILRQWVILPECNVTYFGPEGAPQRIGFDSPSEALRYLLTQSTSEKNYPEGDFPYEILTSVPDAQHGESYELAYPLARSFMAERQLLTSVSRTAAAVCVEGIRVDWSIPGFEPELPCLLSVRNNRKFRTTVSRANLEKDEEFYKVAYICIKTLFDYIKQNVIQVSQLPGQPLLRASSIGRYSGNALFQRLAGKEAREFGSSIYRDLPLAVVEEVGLDGKGKRSLKSLNEVSALPEFWTIESRTVDYLATISRDLGRELSITEFMGSLAPELNDPRLTPVLADAHRFAKDILSSHYITSVEFSMAHQRTLLHWEKKREVESAEVKIPESVMRATSAALINIGAITSSEYQPSLGQHDLTFYISLLVGKLVTARVTGDLSDVSLVSTRIVKILSDVSDLGNLWIGLDAAKDTLISKREWSDVSTLLVAKCIIGIGCDLDASESIGYRFRVGKSPINNYWTLISTPLRLVIDKHKLEVRIPENIEYTIGARINRFDASSYWRDWDKY